MWSFSCQKLMVNRGRPFLTNREFHLRRSDFHAGNFFRKSRDFGHFLARGRSCAMKLPSLFAPIMAGRFLPVSAGEKRSQISCLSIRYEKKHFSFGTGAPGQGSK